MRAASWLRTLPGFAPSPGRAPALLTAAFIVASGPAAGGWFRRKATSPAPAPTFPFTAEDCVAAADRAMAQERWALAAQWLERAHRLAPTSGRVCLDLGFALQQMGDAEGALRMYARGADAGGALSGEARFHAALLCLEAGRPLAEAEAWAVAAFEADPELALVADGGDFGPLHGRPAFEAALTKARRLATRR